MRWTELENFVRKNWRGAGNLLIQPYGLPLSFRNLAPGQTQSLVLPVSANADFVLTSMVLRASLVDAGDGSPDIVPDATVLISDTGSNNQFSSQQMNINNLMGYYGYSVEPLAAYYRIINGRSALSVTITSQSTAVTYERINMNFLGVLVQALQ